MTGSKLPRKSTNLNPPWKPDQSRNPKGRPWGSRNAATSAIEELLGGEAEGLTRKAIDLALDGDMQALRLCLERLCPPRRDRPVTLELPIVKTPPDIVAAIGAKLAAVAAGDITPGEGTAIARLFDTKRKVIENEEIERRITALVAKK